jgi:hypothetical protein
VANISDLISALYPIVGLHTSTLARHASHLRVAGFLPDEDENLSALEAATFLAVVAGARAPTEAVEAARVFANLPLIGVEEAHENPTTGAVGGTRRAISSLTVPSDEQSPLWANARRSFVTALEVVIHQAQDPARKLEELPTAIGILRNLQFPVALIAIGRAETDSTWREARLIFAPSDAASRAGSARDQRMQVWAYLPAITIPLLGDLLADRLDVTAEGRDARPGTAAVFDQRRGQVVQLPAPRSLRVPARAGRRPRGAEQADPMDRP